MDNVTVGFALTGSFCTFTKVIPQIERLINEGINIIPIMSETAYTTDTRFGTAQSFIEKIEIITNKRVIHSVGESEPLGPKKITQAIIVAPCTGNTLAKIANGISDGAVPMAAKSNLRNGNPLIIAISTNDALSTNAKNIGLLLNTKNVYLVPFGQDEPRSKPTSAAADMGRIYDTLKNALKGKQIQPILI